MNRILIVFLFLTTSLFTESSFTLPGRINNSEISVAQFGKMRLFFYMTPEKDQLSRDFIHDLEGKLMLGIVNMPNYFPAPEVIPLSTLYQDPIGYNDNGNMYRDQEGSEIFSNYVKNIKEIAETTLKIKIEGATKGQNLVINFDANKFHQDDFSDQYRFLDQHAIPIPQYIMVQDLTVMDWQMAKGTFSSTIMRDGASADSFIFPLFPNEIVGTLYTEPAMYVGPNEAPENPGGRTFLPHSIVASIDWQSFQTPGSAKGKRTSVAVRGLVLEDEIDALELNCNSLPVNRCISSENANIYPNGLILKKIPNSTSLPVQTDAGYLVQDLDNTEVIQINVEENLAAIEILKGLFNINCPLRNITIKQLIKRDSGFTPLSLEKLNIPPNSTIILVNNSEIPEGDIYYNIAEDFTQEGLPWIQLYNVPPSTAMFVPRACFNRLSLTPVEEILFRDGFADAEKAEKIDAFKKKITTKIELFVFEMN